MTIRLARPEDAPIFEALWRDYLTEYHKQGGELLPTRRNLVAFLELFSAYTTNTTADAPMGVCVLADEDGVLLWGDTGPPRVDTRYDPLAFGWGTYVVPEMRQRGIAREMREFARPLLKALGFKNVQGTALNANKPGILSAESFGWFFDKRAGVAPL